MARPAYPYGGRTTCESCRSIDVRRWHREGRLHSGQHFSCSWMAGGEPTGSIRVSTEGDAASRWSATMVCLFSLLQRPLLWAPSRDTLRRRRVVCLSPVLWPGVCKPARNTDARGIRQARKIRTRLGGSANLCEPFPEKPKRMRRLTYQRLQARAEAASRSAGKWCST
jgi:hypothetical protein